MVDAVDSICVFKTTRNIIRQAISSLFLFSGAIRFIVRCSNDQHGHDVFVAVASVVGGGVVWVLAPHANRGRHLPLADLETWIGNGGSLLDQDCNDVGSPILEVVYVRCLFAYLLSLSFVAAFWNDYGNVT